MDTIQYQKILDYIKKQLRTAAGVMQGYAFDNNGLKHPLRLLQKDISQAIADFLSGTRDLDRWWIMPGLRGVGKTTLLAQTYLQLNSSITNKDNSAYLLYLPLDETVVSGFKLADILEVYQKEILGDYFENITKPVLIFTDETQADTTWALTLKTVYDRSKKVFIFSTGSSALHLQMDASVAGRRSRIKRLHPLSYTEFQMLAEKKLINQDLGKQLREAFYMSSGATEVYERLKKLRSLVNNYQVSCKANSLSNYLKFGTLPFTLKHSKNLLYQDIRTIVDKVIYTDLRTFQNFSTDSLTVIPRLINILALAGDVVSSFKLGQALGVSRPQLSQMLAALVKAEILIKIPAYGKGAFSGSRRPVRYVFTSAAVRAAYLDMAGSDVLQNKQGSLLEDIVSLHYYRDFINTGKGRLSYFYQKGGQRQCDFLLQIGLEKNIPLEFGLGVKGLGQVAAIMNKVKCQYGLVFSKGPLELDKSLGIVKIPLDYFLLL